MENIRLFKALSDPTRLRLVNILWDHELGVNDLVSILGAGQSGISRHLKILHEAGLLRCRRNGTWAFYSVSRDGIPHRFLEIRLLELLFYMLLGMLLSLEMFFNPQLHLLIILIVLLIIMFLIQQLVLLLPIVLQFQIMLLTQH